MRAIRLTVAGLLTSAAAVAAQDTPQLQYDSAYFAWDAGNYPDALARLKRIMTGANAARFLDPAALLTGELYATTEIAPSDRYVVNIALSPPRWSADGRFFLFETGTGQARRTHLYRADGTRVVDVEGFGAALTSNGSGLAYLRVVEDEELRAARAQANAAGRGGRGGGGGGRGGGGGGQLAALEARKSVIVVRDVANGRESIIALPGYAKTGLTYAGDAARLYLTGNAPEANETQIFRVQDNTAGAVTTGAEAKRVVAALGSERLLLSVGAGSFGILDLASSQLRTFSGTSFSASADGSTVVFLSRNGEQTTINVVSAAGGAPTVVDTSSLATRLPVLSPDGRRVVFERMPRDDWELFVIDATGSNERRVTRDIQHDHTARFLTNNRLHALQGENRHRRSYIYDLDTGKRERFFHNNQIRTVAMEYAWAASPDGSKVITIADRDGDTITPERGIYLTDVNKKVSTADLAARIDAMATAENELRQRGRTMFAPIADAVRVVVRDASVQRVYSYEKAMYEFDSKYITQPGNAKAIEYIAHTLRSFGYEPELQWFEPRPGVRTANIIATLKGTRDPDLVYVVSSHFDSVERGPGADDDSSGSSALLEAARIMKNHPMPATIKFAWFTGEEAGLLGSREFVRQAVASGMKIIGALNNDMIGWANDHRLDNTIRYSNVGLRDLQHAAAFGFTNLITYDSKYYQSTDAAAYFEAYGDIVGGIGSYPILGNPHYHQAHDFLETINHQLVTEVAKTTAASLMLMASSPSRLKDVTATAGATGVAVRWTPAVETNISGYIVQYGPPGMPPTRTMRVAAARATLPGANAGDLVWVKAVNNANLESWDWARTIVQ